MHTSAAEPFLGRSATSVHGAGGSTVEIVHMGGQAASHSVILHGIRQGLLARVIRRGLNARAISLYLVLSTQVACNSDDSAPVNNSQAAFDAGAGSQASAGKDADSEAAGTTAGSRMTMLSGVAAARKVTCGVTECAPPKNIAAELLRSVTGLPMTGADTVACCLDAEEGICSSAAAEGSGCDEVAVSDERCPGVDLSALTALVGGLGDSTQEAMIGCCTHDACGLDGSVFGRGCVENAEAKRMLSAIPVIGPLINVPAPRACAAEGQGGEPAIASDADAGI